MGVYDVESLTSLANLIAPYVSLVLASKHKKEVSSIDLVTDFTNLYSLPCYYWNRQTGVKRPVNVAISDVVSTVETAANEELIKIKEMAKDSAESADRADLAALLSALSAAESAATALDLKNQTIDYLNTVKDDEATRVTNENTRLANELERKTNESERINKENIRRSNEDIRVLNENDRIKNENERKSLEITRQSNESLRLELELDRQDAETIRNSNENTRISNENTRETQETNRLNKEAERQLSETDRINNENSRKSAEQSRVTAETNRVNAELNRVTAENNREELFNISKEAADLAADRANDVASHLPYIGEDLYWYLYDESTKSYNKTTKYSKGDNFSVKATFSSIAEMEAYVNPSVETASNPILKIGDFIVIATDVELEDNAKLYVVSNVTSTKITFDYIADFSGARGFTGHTPLLSIGTITTGSAGTAASVSLTEDGIDANGNPKYKINFTIPRGDKGDTGEAAGFGTPTATIDTNVGTPSVTVTASGADTAKVFNFDFKNLKGEKGDKGDPFTYDDFTEELIAILLKPATDATAAANAAALAANTAASNADLATADAINATANAETAANNANQAATNANNAASNANQAADNLNWDNLKDKPSTFTPSAHNHTISEVTNLQATLDGKAAASHTHNYAGSEYVGGAAYSANKINSRGNLTAYEEGSTTIGESGVNLYTVYDNGYPVTYGNLLHIYGLGAGQLLAEWQASSTTGHLYYRSKRDNSSHGWSTWDKIAFVTDNVASANNADTLDGYHANAFLPLSGGTLTGTLGKSSSYIFKPNGGDFRSSGTFTGAICISFPENIGNTMLSMWIDVYNYSTNTSFSVHVGGYTYMPELSFAYSPFAMVYGASHKVRLTYSGGFKIYIGETSSIWSFPQISVRDVVLGASANYPSWLNNWSVSFVTSFPTIHAEILRYAITTDNIGSHALPLSGGTMTSDARISHADGNLYLGRADNNGWVMCQDICSQNASGDSYWSLRTDGTFHAKNATVTGTITYGSLAQGSDVRKKNIINDTMLLIDDIANAPLFTYTYKDNELDKRIHSGTSAQYWEGVNSGLFTTIMEDGSYGLMSSELSLCAAISIAKLFRDYKEKTDKKIEDLLNQINELKELINTLK